jgi:uncharacterized membrane protein YwaF
MRVIKVLTILSVLMFIANAVMFYSIATRGYGQTIDAVRPTFGSADSLMLALLSVFSLVSIPAMALFGVIGIVSAKKVGRSALVLGLLCCVLSAASFVLWEKYAGVPGSNAPNGPTPVTRQATPAPPPPQRQKSSASRP